MHDIGTELGEQCFDPVRRQAGRELAHAHGGQSVDLSPRIRLGSRPGTDDGDLVAAPGELFGDPADARGDSVAGGQERLGDDRDAHASTVSGQGCRVGDASGVSR